jgi:hypothetical protein
MAKEQDVIQKLTNMRVGHLVSFSTSDPNESMEVERILIGKNPGWIVYYQGERKILRELEEAVEFVVKYWNFDLRSFLKRQYMDLEEIEDLGEF